jgi:hypothetical protein
MHGMKVDRGQLLFPFWKQGGEITKVCYKEEVTIFLLALDSKCHTSSISILLYLSYLASPTTPTTLA